MEKTILVVEDNLEFIEGSITYFRSTGNIEAVYAENYGKATYLLEALKKDEGADPDLVYISGAIIDCFFPERKLSFIKDVSLGKYAVEKMALSDPRESKIVEGLKVLKEYVDLEDPDMMNYARFLVNESSRSYDDISQNPIFLAIKQVSILDGPEKEVATLAAKQSLGLSYNEKNTPKDYYGALMKAMEESEANQPLGILVAERASELDIPFILATSTYHHDILTQPIQDYASRNEWTLVDCGPNKEDDKASPEFWERAFRELEKKLR